MQSHDSLTKPRPPTADEVWQALADNPGLAIVDPIPVPRRDNFGFQAGAPEFQLDGFYLEDETFSPVEIELRDPLTNKVFEVTIIGVNPGFRVIRNLKVLAGRFFDEVDDGQRHRVCLVTEALAKVLFPNGWVEAEKTKVRGLQFTIIGIFKEGAETFGQSEITRETVIMPISVMTLLTGAQAVDQIYASANRASNVPAATTALRGTRRRSRRSESRPMVKRPGKAATPRRLA